MQSPLAANGPARLYALILQLRPLQYGTLMPFNGELVHGAFLRWLRSTAPEVVAWLHEGQKRRLFTCSSLNFPRFTPSLLDLQQRNTHLPLEPELTYTLRLTLLLGKLFPLFHEALIKATTRSTREARPPFIQLGKQLLLLEEVQITNDEPSGWTGFTTLSQLVAQASQTAFGRDARLTLEFASLTAFSRGSSKRGFGTFPLMLPLPQMLIQNLLKRWEDIAPPELVGVIQREQVEQYLEEDGIIIIDYSLSAHVIHFTTHQQRGFLGTCTYQLRGQDHPISADAPLTIRQQIYLLSQLAFYTGIGYKTAMGLGQARLKK